MRKPFTVGGIACLLVSSTTSTATSQSRQCRNSANVLLTTLACSAHKDDDILSWSIKGYKYSIQVDPSSETHHKPTSYPWSHEPICTSLLESIGSELCIYTNNTFSRNRGISIFTTPKIAEEFSTLQPFHSPSSLSGVNANSNSWYTSPLPGKGTGMLAKRDLKRGDVITVYTPLFLAHPEESLTTRERERFFRRAVDQLLKRSRDAYLSLSTIYGEPSVVAQDVLKANTFEVQVGGKMHLALFPETSRMNHDCAPNAQYRIDHARLTHYVHAVRPIAKDEEITITYTDPFQPHAIRQNVLRDAFHFTCSCTRCQLGIGADTSLTKIKSLQTALGDWSSQSAATVAKAEELIALMKKRGLDGFLDSAYGYATLSYNAVGDSKKAKKYAKLAIEAIELKDGKGTKDWVMWNELVEDPTKHWSWKYRV